ncbi:DUF1361 domain-containing protein [Candidatus Peregrinibacteria bacterium]|nr:DUF1361 domain-containing protein [Candidatus Peregrinibacteria bacterium]
MEFLFSAVINKYKILMIFWNLFLALVPCLTAYYLAKAVGKKKWDKLGKGQWAFVFLFLFWLLMLPNTAYLFTMVRHLVNYCRDFDCYRVCPGKTWMVMFFFVYALAGVPTFYYAIHKMKEVFKMLFSPRSAVFLPVVVIPLAAIGVMFGLFERYNSWDVLTRADEILKTLASYFTDGNHLLNLFAFTLSFYLIYYGTDIFLWKKKK